MSITEIYAEFPEVASVIRQCKRLSDCAINRGEIGKRLRNDLGQLVAGEATGANGLTVQLLGESRISFIGYCASECDSCAVKGSFFPASPDMSEWHERGLARQAELEPQLDDNGDLRSHSDGEQ